MIVERVILIRVCFPGNDATVKNEAVENESADDSGLVGCFSLLKIELLPFRANFL